MRLILRLDAAFDRLFGLTQYSGHRSHGQLRAYGDGLIGKSILHRSHAREVFACCAEIARHANDVTEGQRGRRDQIRRPDRFRRLNGLACCLGSIVKVPREWMPAGNLRRGTLYQRR